MIPAHEKLNVFSEVNNTSSSFVFSNQEKKEKNVFKASLLSKLLHIDYFYNLHCKL